MDDPNAPEETIVDTSRYIQSSRHKIPQKIGPYSVKGLLKKGSTSFLYLGEHPKTQELLALKVLLPKFVKHPEMMENFLREAKIIEMSKHPNIIKLFGHGFWEQGVYIAMEFVKGISLRKLILQNVLSFKRSLEIIIEIASALEHLHSHGVVHRDLKPDNILLSDEGSVKVIDFGISQLKGEFNTSDSKLAGTLSYMSPEQKEKRADITYASDIYSLALIAYEICIGKLCYGVVQLSKLPKGLRVILEKALSSSPKARHISAHSFIEELSHYVQHNFEENEAMLELSLKELSDFYEDVYLTFSPKKDLLDYKMQMSQASPKGVLSGHIYNDYFQLNEENSVFIMCQPELKGLGGMFHNAFLKGMLQILSSDLGKGSSFADSGKTFLNKLHQNIVHQKLSKYSLALIVFSSSHDTLHYFSCGFNQFWVQRAGLNKITSLGANNNYLGDPDFDLLFHTSINWHVGDSLFLFHSYDMHSIDHKLCETAISKSYLSMGKSQAESILNELKKHSESASLDTSFFITTLQCKR